MQHQPRNANDVCPDTDHEAAVAAEQERTPPRAPKSSAGQAVENQERALESGEENPG